MKMENGDGRYSERRRNRGFLGFDSSALSPRDLQVSFVAAPDFLDGEFEPRVVACNSTEHSRYPRFLELRGLLGATAKT